MKILLLLVLSAAVIASTQAIDTTREPGTRGTSVVLSVVFQIFDSEIFPFDNQLLRRIAFVETRDGTSRITYRFGYHGGIWQVDEAVFEETKDNISHPELTVKHEQILAFFGIDWPSVVWEDLRKPLYSGLAARLFLCTIAPPIPLASDIENQAEYWKQFYDTPEGGGTVEMFVQDVMELAGGLK